MAHFCVRTHAVMEKQFLLSLAMLHHSKPDIAALLTVNLNTNSDSNHNTNFNLTLTLGFLMNQYGSMPL